MIILTKIGNISYIFQIILCKNLKCFISNEFPERNYNISLNDHVCIIK